MIRRSSTAVKDLVVLGVAFLVVLYLWYREDVFEALGEFSWMREGLEVDEIFAAILTLSLAFGVFALRRWRESSRGILERERAEEDFKRLKKAGHDLPAIVVTDQGDQDTVIEALRAGVQDFIAKSPAFLDYLPEAVGRVLEQVRTERLLEESEQHYRSLLDYNPDAVYSLDLEGNFVSANRSGETMSGYKVEEVLGRSFAPLVAPEDLERTFKHFEKAKKGEPQSYEIAMRHKSGRRI